MKGLRTFISIGLAATSLEFGVLPLRRGVFLSFAIEAWFHALGLDSPS